MTHQATEPARPGLGRLTGRYAPSPTGSLHLGNLRTALVAWLSARSGAGRFVMRIDDLDPAVARREHEAVQLADLAALGLDWDGPPLRQSERVEAYEAAIDQLGAAGLVYPCYCSRREIAEASSAPHDGPPGAYPGRCRSLTPAQRARREAEGRRPALRLRASGEVVTVIDRLHGPVSAVVDDLVLRRNDGVAAYNLAVVVDDAAQGVTEVVRGDDLLSSSPRQAYLAALLHLPVPHYLHVPLVLGPTGARLAKRDGAVTLADLAAHGVDALAVRTRLAESLGLAAPGERPSLEQLVARFDPAALPTEPWVFDKW
ncbi:MAG: Glutamate--tRNA ligase [Acidimicrobiia bacterium]|nr:Glutamate--tRNA ligase [Acidimicrobiia bacterium]